MLASWFHFTEHAWPVVVHDDGTLPAEASRDSQTLPPLRIISRREADAALRRMLQAVSFLRGLPRAHTRSR